MSEREPDQGFQVRDRRRASTEGDAPAAPAPPVEVPPSSGAVRGAQESPGERSESPGGRSESPGDERSLVGLFAMLAGLAAAALEGVPDPATGQTQQDPAQAGEIIDVLLLLRERTEGRRTLEESQALDEIIYELQLGYVRATTRR